MSEKKTLLPELLPTPQRQTGQPPRARVAERARLMLDGLAGLKMTAGAVVLAAHCGGYGVVDPLPPPPGQCTSLPDPFTGLSVYGQAVASDGGLLSNAVIELTSYSTIGYRIDAARVTAGGSLLGVEDMSHEGLGGGTQLSITVTPDGSGADILLDVDLGCGGTTTTKHYRVTAANGTYLVIDLQ